jgi:hypothetical protein
MGTKRPDSGLDFAENAMRIVREATGQQPKSNSPTTRTKNPAAVALAKLGASKGGAARAAKLTPAKRKLIAAKAAKARWGRRS